MPEDKENQPITASVGGTVDPAAAKKSEEDKLGKLESELDKYNALLAKVEEQRAEQEEKLRAQLEKVEAARAAYSGQASLSAMQLSTRAQLDELAANPPTPPSAPAAASADDEEEEEDL